MTHIGMPTLLECAALEENAALCRRLGLHFIELNMNLPAYQPDCLDAPLFRSVMQEYGVYFTVHLDENLNAGDFNPYIARAWRQTALDAIEFCRRIQAPIVNIHLPRGTYFTLPDRRVYLFEAYKARYLASVALFRDECARLIGDSPIRICVENTDGFLPFQTEAVDLLLASPVFGLTLDVGHNHSIGGTDEAIILDRLPSLRHMHLHDAAGSRNHLALGSGDIDIPRWVKLAGENDCRMVLETKTAGALCLSAAWLKERGMIPSR